MSKKNIIIIAACGVVVVAGLVLGLTLGNSGSGQTPGEKGVNETKAYLMNMQRLLGERGVLEPPQICYCCDTPLVNGECPYCRGGCDQSASAGMQRLETVKNAPVTEVEGGDAADGDSGGDNCGCQ